jgi:type I restriction enzyme, R subunit
MWTTGFDVPSCSTVYLDKPMRNQALMQTITRANRLFPGKNNGLIVGYVDILSNLNKALALYASTGALGQTVLPVDEKEALVDALRDALEEICRFCQARDVDLDHITTLRQFEWVEALKDVSDQLMPSDDRPPASSNAPAAKAPLQSHPAGRPRQRVRPHPEGHPRRDGPDR